jgi:hypothetical protein
MTSEHRITFDLIADVLDTLDRHGYVRGDDLHAGRAIGLVGDLARIWEGAQDYPAGAHLVKIPSARPGPGAVVLIDRDISTVLAALDEAADYKRDRIETCADCADQSCLTCQTRLQGAQDYHHLAAQIHQQAEARAAHRDQPEPDSPSLSPHQADPAADPEAGQ